MGEGRSLVHKDAVRNALAALAAQAHHARTAHIRARAAARLPQAQPLLLLAAARVAHPAGVPAAPVGPPLGDAQRHFFLVQVY